MKESTDILVIDDEIVILDAIKKIASLIDLTSDTCLNVDEALNNLNQKKYNLIICDIMMPDKDGFELLHIIRQKRIQTPIVITTGFSTLENAVKALYEGAIGFIPKPFSVDELTSIIKRGLEYGKIFTAQNSFTKSKNEDLLSFVPCPPKYYRLGYDSWMNKSREGTVLIGVTDLFLKLIGMIKEIDFMKPEETVYQGGTCLKIYDNNEFSHQVIAPISGKIIDINEKVIVNKSLLEKDPYFQGWIYRMIPENLEHEINNIIPCSSDI
ncbi:MAG: response regulator [Ignavibacteriae bacterium]|nr:response regulator [Ignavibacteriota bacterium]